MLAIQKNTVDQIVTALKPYDNVLIELVFMTNETTITAAWGAEIAQTIVAADSKRIVVLPAEWAVVLPPSNIVQSCGGTSKTVCTNASTDAYYRLPPSSFGKRTLLDSAGFLPAALHAAGQNRLAAYRNTYWSWAMSGGAAIYNVDWSYTVGFEGGTATDPQASGAVTPSGPAYRKMASTLANFVNALDLSILEPSTAWVRLSKGDSETPSGTGGVFGLAPSPSPSSTGYQHPRHQQHPRRQHLAGHQFFVAFFVGYQPGARCTVDLRETMNGIDKTQCVGEFVDPSTGGVVGGEHVIKGSSSSTLALPASKEKGSGIALRVLCTA
jgi:hypothetical protein